MPDNPHPGVTAHGEKPVGELGDVELIIITAGTGSGNVVLMAPVAIPARQIIAAIRGGRKHIYGTRRWRLLAGLPRAVPAAIYSRLAASNAG